ncbi:MAG: glutathione S-transferase [Xanthobacteraceae bacterium]|nr:glutathione S-transferase [Xanthobacteraceae bacterium]
MKLYDYAPAPNPRRVRMFLAEKGIALPTIQVDLRANAQFTPEFRAINPDCTVPVLELDDGTRLADVMAICVYFEMLQPQPALMGASPLGAATVTARQREAERDGFFAVAEALRNSSAAFKGRALPGADDHEQIPALVERGRARAGKFLHTLDARLATQPFVAGEAFSIADITAVVAVDFARWIRLAVPEELVHLHRWHAEVSARPSAKA